MMQATDIVAHAKKHNLPVAALTDVHSLSALPEFLLKCYESGIHGIAGLTLQIKENRRVLGEMVLLAKGGAGFAALRDLLDVGGYVGNDERYNPEMGIPLDDLLSGKFSDKLANCIMLDGFPGSIGDALLKKDGASKDIVGASALLQDPNSRISRLRAQFNDGDYLGVHTPGAKNPLASVLSMPSSAGKDETPRVLESTLGYAKDQAQSWQTMAWFKAYAQDYLDGLGVGDKVNDLIRQKYQHATLDAAPTYGPGEPPFLGARYLIARCPTPKIFKTQQESLPLNWSRETPVLRDVVEQAWATFSQTLPESDRPLYRARVDEELATIQSCHFEDYFVNIIKIKQIAKEDGNALMLRGSAVSSLIMHMLEMTPIDPIKERLLFARFISSGRVEDPDVDIEFVEPNGVSRAIEAACLPGQMAKLSSDRGISNPLQLLTLAKDALLNFYTLSDTQKAQVEADYEFLTAPIRPKAKPQGVAQPNKRWDKSPLWHKNMGKWIERFWNKQPQNQRGGMRNVLVGIAQNYNVPAISSNLSPNSVVFVPDGVRRYFNVLSARKNERIEGEVGRITQNKYNLAATGHIKYDLLSNRSFARAMNQMETLGLPQNMKMDPNDPSIPFVFHNDAFMGVNQVSGFVGATQARMFLPKNFNELTAINALIRDGALVSQGAVDQYLRAKNAPDGVQLDALLQPILGETYGCLLYEEQLLRLLTEVGGFEWKTADKFRSSLKKGKFEVIDQYEQPFIQQAVSIHGVDAQTASRWYQPLREKRGRFVFNKAHAVAYAHLAVQQCWLKTHYPAHYAAEMVLDPKAQFIDETITARMALKDWAKLYPQGGPQQAQDFIKAIGSILVREETNPDSGYRRDLGSVQLILSNAIESGDLDFALPPGVDRGRAMGLCHKMFAKLSERGYSPVKHGTIKNEGRPQSAGSPRPGAEPASQDGVQVVMAPVSGPETGVPPANRREGYIDWNKVMVSQLLMFFREAGIISNLSVEYNTNELDRLRFNVTAKDGKIHPFHLVCPTSDSSRNHAGKRKINSGMHQDRTDPTDTLVLAAEISALVDIPGLPKGKLVTRERGGLSFDTTEDWSKFRSAMGAYCRKSPHALHDIISGGIASSNVPKMPTSPVMIDLQPAQMDAGYKKARELFEKGRAVHFDGLYSQFQHGHISVAQVRSDKPSDKKNGVRPVYLSVLANYIEVTSTTPLYQSPLIRENCLSPGGHQQFMSEKVDPKKYESALREEREKGLPYKPKIHLAEKVGKLDLGATTSAVRALVHGHITPGSQTLWLTEAALDAWSFNELQRELRQLAQVSPVPFAEENAISVKSAGFATRLFEEMLSISVINKKDGSPLDFCQVQSKKIAKPFADADAKNLADWFKKQNLHFMRDDRPENLEASQRLQALMRSVGLTEDEIKGIVKVHQSSPSRTFSQNVNAIYDKHVIGPNNGFLHQSNMSTWLRSAGLAVIKQDDGTYLAGRAAFEVQRGRAFSTFSLEEQMKVRRSLVSKFQYMTGAKSIGLALDNDLKADGKPGAGLVDALQVKSICDMLEIPVAELMPMERPDVVLTLQGRPMRFDLKDYNDYLTAIKALRGVGQEQDAQKLLREYASYLKQPALNGPAVQMAPQPHHLAHKPT
jgi:hypothetical protein